MCPVTCLPLSTRSGWPGGCSLSSIASSIRTRRRARRMGVDRSVGRRAGCRRYAGALLALAHLGVGLADETARAAVALGVGWLFDLQNRDGGIPTFCRGWGALPFDRSSPDLTRMRSSRGRRGGVISAGLGARVYVRDEPRHRLSREGAARRRLVGAAVVWQRTRAGRRESDLGTSRILMALARVTGSRPRRAVRWRLAARRGCWPRRMPTAGGAARRGCVVIEETALAVDALAALALASSSAPSMVSSSPRSSASAQPVLAPAQLLAVREAIARGAAWLVQTTARGAHHAAIGHRLLLREAVVSRTALSADLRHRRARPRATSVALVSRPVPAGATMLATEAGNDERSGRTTKWGE